MKLAAIATLGNLVANCAFAQASPPIPSQITLAIGGTPGAAYDMAGRVIAKHLPKHLPGNPRIIVQYMPGAGSLTLVNHVYNVAPKDGSFIGLVQRGYGVQPILDNTGIQYDPLKLTWLGSISSEVSVLWSWHSSQFRTIEDLRQREMIVPGTGAGGDGYLIPMVINNVLSTKMKLVMGYAGNNESMMAIEKGEGQGSVSSLSTFRSTRAAWLAEQKINFIVQLGTRKSNELPDVPLVTEFATNDADRSVLELIMSRQDMAYPLVAAPGTPSGIATALRTAIMTMAHSEEFRSDAAALGMTGTAMSGQEIQDMLSKIYAQPKAITDGARLAATRKMSAP